MTESAPYIMDDPRESERLLDKVDPLSWIKTYLEPHLKPGTTVASIGCGPGVFLRELASLYPTTQFLGIDISPERIRDAQLRLHDLENVSVEIGSIQDLPIESNGVDLIFSRFLLEYVPDKEQAVQEMVRVCRPSGTVLLQDLDGQLLWNYPEDTELQENIERLAKQLASTGFDAFVGRKLFHLCYKAGLADIKVGIEPYHLYAGAISASHLRNWRRKLDIAMPHLKKMLGGDAAARSYANRFLQYLERDDTLTYSCLFTVTAKKPPGPRGTGEMFPDFV